MRFGCEDLVVSPAKTSRNRELTELKPPSKTIEFVESDEALLELLATRFGLHFPREIRFRISSSVKL